MIKITAKISIALDEKDGFINIADAVKGEKYYCVNCKEELYPSKGKKNIHHYRHFQNKGALALQECEFYSSGDSDFSILIDEKRYKNHVRFIIEDTFRLKIRLPHIDKDSFSSMNINDYYFTVEVDNHSVFSTDLGERSIKRRFEVAFKKKYLINIVEERHARILNYQIEKTLFLTDREVLIFKKTGEEYINIPYPKTNLSESIFLVSLSPLILHADLYLYKYKEVEEYYIYYVLIEELSKSLIDWFQQEIGYTIIPNRKWIDIVYPATFEYSEDSVLVEKENVKLSITPLSKKDIITVVTKDKSKEELLLDESNFYNLNLKLDKTHFIKINNEIANELLIKRVKEISPCSNFIPTVSINEKKMNIINLSSLPQKVNKIQSDLEFQLFNEGKYPYWTRETIEENLKSIHFPFLGTIQKRKEINDCEIILAGFLNLQNHFVSVKNNEYRKILEYIKNTDIANKYPILKLLLKNYNKLPKDIVEYLRREGY